jgi:major membrane immunogen (membrane-anchored lipoprotein)
MFRKIMTLFVSLLLLTACNSKDVTFSGESDNWEADLKITQNSDTFENQDFVLKYKGEDIDSVGEITYEVDSIGGEFGRKGESLEENGSIRDDRESKAANAKIPEDAEVEVTVEWNGNTETFTLTQQ